MYTNVKTTYTKHMCKVCEAGIGDLSIHFSLSHTKHPEYILRKVGIGARPIESQLKTHEVLMTPAGGWRQQASD
eukprot:8260495-Pyramimonas_sp.AAC.1